MNYIRKNKETGVVDIVSKEVVENEWERMDMILNEYDTDKDGSSMSFWFADMPEILYQLDEGDSVETDRYEFKKAE